MTNVINNKYAIIGDFKFDNLIAGEQQPIISKGITLKAGQGVLARGTLLGIITLTGLAVICDSTKNDGSEKPAYILGLQQGQLMDPTQTVIDTGSPEATLNVPAMAYQTGIFNRNAIITKSGQPISGFESQLRTLGIILRDGITNPTTALDGIALDTSTLTLTASGDTGTLTPIFYPSNASDQGVTWSSSAPTVATVSSAGVVTPLTAGTTTITVTALGGGYVTAYKATCTVTVEAA